MSTTIFKILSKGLDAYIEIDIAIIERPIGPATEQIASGIYLLFQNDILQKYKDEGLPFIKQVISANADVISEAMGGTNTFYVKRIESHLAHYCSNIFIGATILWLNENLKLNLDMPIYKADADQKKFLVTFNSLTEEN